MHGKINDEIKREAEKRGIQYLVHFTRSCNISGILKRGILPVVYHQRYEVMSVTNDPNRYDDQTDSVSLSIPFPNCKMFFKQRCKEPYEKCVALLPKSDMLWCKDRTFHRTNAASNQMRRMPVEEKKTLNAFNSMFYDDQLGLCTEALYSPMAGNIAKKGSLRSQQSRTERRERTVHGPIEKSPGEAIADPRLREGKALIGFRYAGVMWD